MSIETLLAANIKATEALTEALTGFGATIAAVIAGAKKATGKDKTTSTATDPAATSGAAPAGTAAGSVAGASVVDFDTFAGAVTNLARAGGKDRARAVINQFGAEGRASNIKEIDRNKAYAAVQADQAKVDAEKTAAEAAVKAAAGSGDLI